LQPKSGVVAYLYESSATGTAEADRQSRPFERIAREFAEQIRAGRLVRGQKLPTEREMGEHFGVSRGVIREAVKMLDAMGLVESRQGSGIYVRNNPIPSISRAMTLSVTPDEQSIAALFEFRAILEASAAERAAKRRTESDCHALDVTVIEGLAAARAGDAARWHAVDNRFHRAVADASGNPYLGVAIDAVREMQVGVIQMIRELGGSPPAAEHHRAIAAAIVASDPSAAAERMRAHIEYTESKLQHVRERVREMGVQQNGV
jgi:GntR family transcriptional regulator, transcriptional repressor for pyruvate dehydrogenase complex